MGLKYKKILFYIMLSLFFYYLLLIFRTSFVIDGERYFVLQDDEMISMRYAKNLINGNGLVWNKEERVEGITNPLWTIYMALIHFFPIPISKISFVIQFTGCLLLLLSFLLLWKVSFLITDSELISTISALLFGFYYPVVYWCIMGTEVSILIFINIYALLKILEIIRNDKNPIFLYIFLGLGTFVRMDYFLIYIGFFIFLIISQRKNRFRHFVSGIFLFIFFLTFQTILRFIYYRDIFPNTYYLKMTGFPVLFRITRGIFVYIKFLWSMNIILVILAPFVLFFKRKKEIVLILWLFILQSIYSIYVGGDIHEEYGGSNRFISIVMPCFFILFSYSIYLILNWFEKKLNFNIKKMYVLITLFSIFIFNGTYGPETNAEVFLITRPRQRNFNKRNTEIALILNKITDKDAKIAVTCAGTTPYFCDRYFIDLLGKSDKAIAKVEAKPFNSYPIFFTFVPGHMKHDYEYSIKFLKPDVIVVNIWYNPDELEKKDILRDYISIKLIDGLLSYYYTHSKNIFLDRAGR